jgi:hypothetical protein
MRMHYPETRIKIVEMKQEPASGIGLSTRDDIWMTSASEFVGVKVEESAWTLAPNLNVFNGAWEVFVSGGSFSPVFWKHQCWSCQSFFQMTKIWKL